MHSYKYVSYLHKELNPEIILCKYNHSQMINWLHMEILASQI